MSVRGVNKLSIIGAGTVGSSLTYASLTRGVARHVVLHDINATKIRTEAFDPARDSQLVPQARVGGSEGPGITRGSDVVVITAGAKQKPGETRMDLAASTVDLMRKAIPPLVERSPEAIFLMVTNPVDVTTYAVLKINGLPHSQLFGSGTMLDSSRLRYPVVEACEVAMVNVHTHITGEHDDSEIPLWSAAAISGVPLLNWERQTEKLDESTHDSIAGQMVNATYEVIAGKGVTNYAIRLAAAWVIESVLRGEHRILPVSNLAEDWYSIKGVCLSVLITVGRQNAGHTLRQSLTGGELGCMHGSAGAIRYTLSSLGFWGPKSVRP